MNTLLYISASQYSGSTLASFLLNTHPKIVTVGHMTGWPYAENEKFYCSCGEQLEECPLFNAISQEFKNDGLPFDYRKFGTEYRLANNDYINHLLTTSIPLIGGEGLENIRNWIVQNIPFYKNKLSLQDRANYIFIRTALEHMKASVFVDNSHDPYRLHHLNRIKKFNLKNIYLLRDPRGVAYSHKKHKSWDVALSTKLWLRRQSDTLQITKNIAHNINIYYEDLCDKTDEILASIHRFVDVKPTKFEGDFKTNEHHILGNVMRLKKGEISLDTKWKDALTTAEIKTVEKILAEYIDNHPNHQLSTILEHYLNT